MGNLKVLYAGDGEALNYLVTKGLNFYMAGGFVDESGYLKWALQTDPDIEVFHISPGESLELFPREIDVLKEYRVVILSDIGADSILFYMNREVVPMGPNRLKLIKQYVLDGGGLLMIGGWSSFGGWGGQARWSNTPVEEVLPVIIKDGDDRVEVPEGCAFERWNTNHLITKDLPIDEPFVLLGYNRFKAKPDAKILAWIGDDPAIVVGEYDKGRSMAVATDCAPHWAGSWLKWSGYNKFWVRSVRWLAKELGDA